MDDMKRDAMTSERQNMKAMRMKALFDMEKQRQDTRVALYQMSVWNTFNPKIVNSIYDSSRRSCSIEEMVRVKASTEHRRKKLGKTNSAANFFSTGTPSRRGSRQFNTIQHDPNQ